MNVKVTNFKGDSIWVSLPKAYWEGKEELRTGIFLTGLYRSAKTGRMVRRIYSQWFGEGESYQLLSLSSWIDYCDLAGIDPQVPAEEL